jgi:hypothetical protein
VAETPNPVLHRKSYPPSRRNFATALHLHEYTVTHTCTTHSRCVPSPNPRQKSSSRNSPHTAEKAYPTSSPTHQAAQTATSFACRYTSPPFTPKPTQCLIRNVGLKSLLRPLLPRQPRHLRRARKPPLARSVSRQIHKDREIPTPHNLSIHHRAARALQGVGQGER